MKPPAAAVVKLLCDLVAGHAGEVWCGTRFTAGQVAAFAADQEMGLGDYAAVAVAGGKAWQVFGMRRPTIVDQFDNPRRPMIAEMILRTALGHAVEIKLSERWAAALARLRAASC